jgi:hypothetical protein
MLKRFPVLSGDDKAVFPSEKARACPICGKPFSTDSFAYLSAGACYDILECKVDGRDLTGFFVVGFKGKDPDMSDSGECNIVQDLIGGQFDLNFCSTSCLRRFFLMIVKEVAQNIGQSKGSDEGEDLLSAMERDGLLETRVGSEAELDSDVDSVPEESSEWLEKPENGDTVN